ncbi:MAG: hypothetical protein GY861_21235 [bacterium]|nr:hypothetical protein [bacterium]
MRIFDTRLESFQENLLKDYFGDCIYNPNNKEVRNSSSHMKHCLSTLRSEDINSVAFSMYYGSVGLGVYKEVNLAKDLHKPVYLIAGARVYRFFGSLRIFEPRNYKCYAKIDELIISEQLHVL